jgi:hypothetical protein
MPIVDSQIDLEFTGENPTFAGNSTRARGLEQHECPLASALIRRVQVRILSKFFL